ncbi:MAG TPA: SMI1/KNR4 family protein [Chitinophaga sp.]
MMEFNDQIKRIKDKLPKAKKADRNLEVFGAKSHKYQLNDPATKEEVSAFEQKYGIELPACYKAFILQVGNGGIAYEGAAAGPFYGIYPLGKHVDELIYSDARECLKAGCRVYPEMPDEYWRALNENIDDDSDISDEDYELELGKIFGGILPIGSQGCSYLHGIVVNGPYRGRVVNICADRQKPQFTFEANFLDWYERWLDEVISGELVGESPRWFGYVMGGSDIALSHALVDAGTIQQRSDCLDGILNKKKVKEETIQIIEEQLLQDPGELKIKLLQVLTKFDYKRAKPHLIELSKTDLLPVFQFVYWYAKDKSGEWLPLIAEHIGSIDNDETFTYCTYLLRATGTNFGHLLVPFTESDNESIRATAFYTLGKVKNKKDLMETFIKGLSDHSTRVIVYTLQALIDVKDTRLLPHYKQVAERFPEEKDYVLSNLNQRLADYGLSNETILSRNEAGTKGRRTTGGGRKWYHLWR